VNRDDLCYESTVDLVRHIRAGEVSPRQAVDAYLDRIARVDPRLDSYLHVAADHARQAARRAEQALAERRPLGPLHGVPVAVKDLFDTAGMPTTCGSPRILGDNVPTRTATAVERLEQAGAVLLGKLHMTEFAFIAHHPDTRPATRGRRIAHPAGRQGRPSRRRQARSVDARHRHGGVDPASSAWCGAVGLKPTWGGCRATACSRCRHHSITSVRSRAPWRTRHCSTASPARPARPVDATASRAARRTCAARRQGVHRVGRGS
jgi:hypothetical protein